MTFGIKPASSSNRKTMLVPDLHPVAQRLNGGCERAKPTRPPPSLRKVGDRHNYDSESLYISLFCRGHENLGTRERPSPGIAVLAEIYQGEMGTAVKQAIVTIRFQVEQG